jgi:hypothetical protein
MNHEELNEAVAQLMALGVSSRNIKVHGNDGVTGEFDGAWGGADITLWWDVAEEGLSWRIRFGEEGHEESGEASTNENGELLPLDDAEAALTQLAGQAPPAER